MSLDPGSTRQESGKRGHAIPLALQDDRVATLYRAGEAITMIARKLGVSDRIILRHLRFLIDRGRLAPRRRPRSVMGWIEVKVRRDPEHESCFARQFRRAHPLGYQDAIHVVGPFRRLDPPPTGSFCGSSLAGLIRSGVGDKQDRP